MKVTEKLTFSECDEYVSVECIGDGVVVTINDETYCDCLDIGEAIYCIENLVTCLEEVRLYLKKVQK